MDILNPENLRGKARTALRRGREPKKLIYTYAGISLAVSAAVYLINLWLNHQISGTGGLGNIGTRAIFSTIQTILPLAASAVAMCMDLGFLGGMLRIVRGQYADHTDLKTGFRKFWPLVRLTLIRTAMYFAAMFLSVQLGSLIFSFTPWAGPLLEVLTPIAMSGEMMMEEAELLELLPKMLPLLITVGIVTLVMLLPMLFKLRMCCFCLLDDPKGRALAAIGESNRMMRGRFVQMLKVDLSNWLYYGATVLVTLVLYSDVILLLLGVPLPLDVNVYSMIIYGLSAALQCAVHIWLRPTAELTYLAAYDQLREKPEDSGVVLGNIFEM